MRRLLVLLLFLSVHAHAQPAERRAALEKMLDLLRTAPDEHVATALESRIQQAWAQAGTPAVNLLVSKGLKELAAKEPAVALTAFSDAIVLDPTMAEAWHQHGIASYLAGDMAGAARDLRETLKLEPRHFGAWRTLERLAETQENWKAAYDAWQHVLDIDPRTEDGEDKAKELKKKAFGDNT